MLVTHDRADFILLHDAWVSWSIAFGMTLPAHFGILVLDAAPHQQLAAVILDMLEIAPPEELMNVLLWWHRAAGWLRRMPGVGWEPGPQRS
ncbi:MAG: hypothetical protein QOF51_2665 [Chloroflexota bacterium]|jgi:hypothetical protein|nr:hypothetical protein [Chloroflexota bacterium]